MLGLSHAVIGLQFSTFLHDKFLRFASISRYPLLLHINLFIRQLQQIIIDLLDVLLVKPLNLLVRLIHLLRFSLWVHIRFQNLPLGLLSLLLKLIESLRIDRVHKFIDVHDLVED